MYFSYAIGRTIASAAIVCGALSSFVPSYAAAASTVPASLRNTDRTATPAPNAPAPAKLDKEPANNIIKKEEKDYTIVYTRTKDLAVRNPFPSAISDAEVAAAFKHDGSIQKYFFTPDSDPAKKPVRIENSIIKDEPGTYTIYTVVNKYSKTGLSNTIYAQGYQTRNGSILKDGSIYAGSDKTVTYTMHPYSFEFNGLQLANNATKRTKIEMQSRDHYLYYKIVFSSDGSLNERILTNYGDETNTGGQEFSWFMYDAAPKVSAQFHFVDDFAYRAQTQQPDADALLKQRGNSDTHPLLSKEDKDKGFVISAVPNHKIDGLSDLTKPVATDPAYFMRNRSNDVKYSILSFKDDPDAPKTENGRPTGVFRPTLEQLTSTNIPGYVYWDNDIDKPKGGTFQNNDDTKENPGNHYLSFAYEMKDGKPYKRLDTKYYYLTFRKIPTQIVVHQFKKDAATGKSVPITTGSFDVYQRVGDKDVLVKKHITLSNDFAKDTAPTLDGVVSDMKTKQSFQQAGYYQVNDKIYLQPGSYVLRQTQAGKDAPKLDDIAFTIAWQTKTGDTTTLTKEPSTLHVIEIDRDKLKPPAPKPPVPNPPAPREPDDSHTDVPDLPVPTPAAPLPASPASDTTKPTLVPAVPVHAREIPRNDRQLTRLPQTSDMLIAPFAVLALLGIAGACITVAALRMRRSSK
ncbi:hypothetical protein HMPREF9248_0064 [Fannyhessea vaginae PB189-T1-4]|uniref:Uncharacterized protein n=1 Tax=Fannyhessea vaginae PB189-T1-4 TaxID=866774 RepID=A0ABN0AYU4_9ACTN|nr:hypothetical protein [Fannyhessea vaginae]EFL43687.1 hypothetical protein HMPREF9248_0064 [Fannyhessea vaginae PB189-T1-4]